LLENMSQLVREQAAPVGGVRRILPVPEHDVAADCAGARRYGLSGTGGQRSCVDAHIAQVVPEPRLQRFVSAHLKRLTRRLQQRGHRGRRVTGRRPGRGRLSAQLLPFFFLAAGVLATDLR